MTLPKNQCSDLQSLIFNQNYFWKLLFSLNCNNLAPNHSNFTCWGCSGILRTSSCWWAQRFLKLMHPGLRNWRKREGLKDSVANCKYSPEEDDGEMVMGQQTAASVHTPVSVSRIILLIQPGPGARCAAEESNWSLRCYLLISSCICFLLSLGLASSVHTNPPTPTLTLTRPN